MKRRRSRRAKGREKSQRRSAPLVLYPRFTTLAGENARTPIDVSLFKSLVPPLPLDITVEETEDQTTWALPNPPSSRRKPSRRRSRRRRPAG